MIRFLGWLNIVSELTPQDSSQQDFGWQVKALE